MPPAPQPVQPPPGFPVAIPPIDPAAPDTPRVIEARGVSVRYQVTPPDATHKSDLVSRFLRPKRPYYALRGLDLDVHHGEMMFLIGRNGAGKTTTLKVLSETLVPDEGEVRFRGRTSAFLSMGLGFQHDLSGNQNLAMALMLMGVPRSEIPDRRADINAFTQLGSFMDMPVRTYSAGMRARLGFAIATAIEPDILIMDEIINAGDAQFREAAAERLDGMLSKAKAIIVATHNLHQVDRADRRTAWIEAGVLRAIGPGDQVLAAYRQFIAAIQNDPAYDLRSRRDRFARAPAPPGNRSASKPHAAV